MKIKKKIRSMYQKKCCEGKHVDLILIGERGKRHYVSIKDFNAFMYDNNLHCGKKHLFCYYLQAFSREEILKPYIKDCLKINGKGRIMILKKGEYDKLNNYERKIKPTLITYADFESILVLGNNGK